MLAPGKDDVTELVLQKHQTCPFCAECLIGKDVKIKISMR